MNPPFRPSVRVLALIFGLCPTWPAAGATPAPKTVLPPAVLASLKEERGLVYARHGARELQLDLYRPKAAAEPLPALVCIHGGGWQKGSRAGMADLSRALAARGYVVASVSYRLSDEAAFPAQLHDVKAAVRWLRANAAAHGIDPARIGAIGHSAGGHLAALLATTGGVRELEGSGNHDGIDSRIQAAVAGGTQTDLTVEHVRAKSEEKGGIYPKFLGDSYAKTPAAYAAASPLHHLDRSDPPLAFFTGEQDHPSTHADAMRARLAALGIPTALTVVPGAPHALLGNPRFFDQVVASAAAFFEARLATPRSGK